MTTRTFFRSFPLFAFKLLRLLKTFALSFRSFRGTTRTTLYVQAGNRATECRIKFPTFYSQNKAKKICIRENLFSERPQRNVSRFSIEAPPSRDDYLRTEISITIVINVKCKHFSSSVWEKDELPRRDLVQLCKR